LILGVGVYIVYFALVGSAQEASIQRSLIKPQVYKGVVNEYKIIYICTRQPGPSELLGGSTLGNRKDASYLANTSLFPNGVSLEYSNRKNGNISHDLVRYEKCPGLIGSEVRRYAAWTAVRDYELDCIKYVSHCNHYVDQRSVDFSVYPYERGRPEAADRHAP
jgi:hypothetical protein